MSAYTPTNLPPPPRSVGNGISLFLDFDGTLVELAERPDAVGVTPELQDLVRRLNSRLDGRIAILSGRPTNYVRQLFGELRFAVAGCHGLEFAYPDGEVLKAPRPPGLDLALREMHMFARGASGVLVEEKPLGAALHFRQAPDLAALCGDLATELATRYGLVHQTGKMMAEVRAGGGDKGTALRELMSHPPFRGTSPIFLGDDDTDEPGFLAAAEMGGAGIIVGDGRSAAARYRLADVEAVLYWLDEVSRG